MKPLTVKDLRDELKIALKENNKINNKFIFKQVKIDTRKSIESAIKANNEILVKQIDKVVNDRLSEFSDVILETIDTNRNEANQNFDSLSKNVKDIKQDVKFMHQDMKDLEVDFFDKPSRKQFEEFKSSFKNYPTV